MIYTAPLWHAVPSRALKQAATWRTKRRPVPITPNRPSAIPEATLVDTNVLLDLATDDSRWAE